VFFVTPLAVNGIFNIRLKNVVYVMVAELSEVKSMKFKVLSS